MKHAVDFDGTLATYGEYDPDLQPDELGEPIPAMVNRVKKWLAQGDEVVILTARVYPDFKGKYEAARKAIEEWCVQVFGQPLEVTCMKDPMFSEIWDDKAVRVNKNTGLVSDQTDIVLNDVDAVEPTDAIGNFLGG